MFVVLSLPPVTVVAPFLCQVGNLHDVYHFELPELLEKHSTSIINALKKEYMVSWRERGEGGEGRGEGERGEGGRGEGERGKGERGRRRGEGGRGGRKGKKKRERNGKVRGQSEEGGKKS